MNEVGVDLGLIFNIAKSTFPDTLAKEIVSLEKFNKQENRLETYISFGGVGASFSNEILVAKVKEKINDENQIVSIDDKIGNSWNLEVIDITICNFKLTRNSEEIILPSLWLLSKNKSARQKGLDNARNIYSITSYKFQKLCKIIESRELNHIELSDFFDCINSSIEQFTGILSDKIESGSDLAIKDFVPNDPQYYAGLTGSFEPTESLDDYVKIFLTPLLNKLAFSHNKIKALERAEIISGHQKFFGALDIENFEIEEIISHIKTSTSDASIFSLLSIAERFLPLSPVSLELSKELEYLLQGIKEQITNIDNIKVKTISSLLVMVDAQLAMNPEFRACKPFERRNFVISHSNLLFKVFSKFDYFNSEFISFVDRNCLNVFYVKTLLDLRMEHRWLPEFVTAQQLKAEVFGRLSFVAQALEAIPINLDLRNTFNELIKAESHFDQNVQLKKYFSGPLDSEDSVQPLSTEWIRFVESEINSNEITTKNFTAIINLARNFRFPGELLDEIIGKLNSLKGSIRIHEDANDLQNFFIGMSYLAHSNLRSDLATLLVQNLLNSDDQILSNFDKVGIFQVILASAAAFQDMDRYCEFIETNMYRLSIICYNESDAIKILPLLQIAQSLDPELVPYLSRSVARLQSTIM